MATTGDYCTLTELKARLWPSGEVPDSTDDAILQAIITSASKAIEEFCGRRFYTTTADETRYFPGRFWDSLYPNIDIVSITTLATDADGDGTYEDTWAATDYILSPVNASLDGWPYSYIMRDPDGDYQIPVLGDRYPKAVKIVGKFGWSTIPGPVKQACLLYSMRLFKRIDTPLGVVSNPVGGEMRLIPDIDPDLKMLLSPYRLVKMS